MAQALKGLARLSRSVRVSPLYETRPHEMDSPRRFLNLCVEIGSKIEDPFELLEATQRIETKAGRPADRIRSDEKTDRTLDIDVLLFESKIIRSERLVLPHPEMFRRDFVLVPLLDLEPELVDPASRRKLADFLAELPNSSRTFPSLKAKTESETQSGFLRLFDSDAPSDLIELGRSKPDEKRVRAKNSR